MDITFWKNPETGLVESIDTNGKVVSVQKDPRVIFNPECPVGFTEYTDTSGKKTWVQDGLASAEVSSWIYNPAIGGAICTEISQGALLSTMSKKFSWCPPYAILARWLHKVPEFKEMFEQAKKDRAELHYEEIMQVADETYHNALGGEDEIAAAKLKIDSRKWVAEKGDNEKFGQKTKQEVVGAVSIVVHTGIIREAKKIVDSVEQIEHTEVKELASLHSED